MKIVTKVTNFKSRLIKLATVMMIFMTSLFFNSLHAFAGGALAETPIVKGTNKLLNDATTILLIAAPTIGALLIIYFQIRRGAADDQDQKKWNNRTIAVIVSIVVAVSASSIIKVIIYGYMGVPAVSAAK